MTADQMAGLLLVAGLLALILYAVAVSRR